MGRERSGTDATFAWLKKEMKDWEKFHRDMSKLSRDIDKYHKYKERQRAYEKQQREIRLQKWENRINWLADKINEHNKKKNFGKTNEIIYKCDNCNAEIKKDDKYCPKCGCEFVSKENAKESNKPKNELLHVKEKLLEKTKVNIKKDIKKYSREDIVEEINNIIKLVNDNYNDVVDYVQNRLTNFDEREFVIFKSMYDHIFGWIEEVEKDLKRDSSKEQAKESYRKINMIYKRSCELNEGILNKEKTEDTKEKIKRNAIPIESHNERYAYDYNEMDENIDEDENEDIVYRELEDWQKKEVDEGNYDPYNFEEDELEEDDYYYEDDKE